MNKPNNIRKKALDYAKKRQWDKALAEFSRLVEVEQHNPNLFNEIGDIQLKLGNKREAFKRYHEAIDAYAKVGLHNNAVAVCKKILRLNPSDVVVYGNMATLRKRQGFEREAVEFSLTFFDRVLADPNPPGEGMRCLVIEMVQTFEATPEVLERAADYLQKDGPNAEAADVLQKLSDIYRARGMAGERERTRQKMEAMGFAPAAPAEPPAAPDKLETVESHRAGRRADDVIAFNGSVPPHIRRGGDGDTVTDFGVIDVGAPKVPEPIGAAADAKRSEGRPAPTPYPERRAREFDPDPSALDKDHPWSRVGAAEAPAGPVPAPEEAARAPSGEYVIPEAAAEADSDSAANVKDLFAGRGGGEGASNAAAEDLASSMASEVTADVAEGDHRSRYDLGMAYLEMGLFADAIREFQFAAESPAYQARSLEMIGSCLISQRQPKLAVKQLSKGLALVEGDDRAALGIKYNLAVAYEMIGEDEKAKALFEDVYVVDITFRDVQEKVKKYSS